MTRRSTRPLVATTLTLSPILTVTHRPTVPRKRRDRNLCIRGHERTAENTRWMTKRDGSQYRACRDCERERYRQRKWAAWTGQRDGRMA